jgi:hypothetical protein
MPSIPARPRAIAAALAVLLLAAAAWWRPIDVAAESRLDAGLRAAFAAFATARALNAAISLAQSAQVSAQLGLGVSVSPAAVLDPVDDLVERFSDAMLAATVAFGVQKVLLAIGSHWLLAAALGLSALAWAGASLAGRARPRWLTRTLVLLLLARFAVPAATLGTDALVHAFLAPREAEARAALDVYAGQAKAAAQPTQADAGAVGAARDWLSRGAELGARLETLGQAAGRLAEHVTTLIVVFLLQTMLFPIALGWGLWRAALAMLRPPG